MLTLPGCSSSIRRFIVLKSTSPVPKIIAGKKKNPKIFNENLEDISNPTSDNRVDHIFEQLRNNECLTEANIDFLIEFNNAI